MREIISSSRPLVGRGTYLACALTSIVAAFVAAVAALGGSLHAAGAVPQPSVSALPTHPTTSTGPITTRSPHHPNGNQPQK